MTERCEWCETEDRMIAYHDLEWGVPLHDDRKHFEFLALDAFQAGLSWAIILRKREEFESAFAGFDPEAVARFGDRDVERLLGDAGIVRNRQKITATILNAGAFLRLQEEVGSFDEYIWGFVDGRPVHNAWRDLSKIPAKTDVSERASKDLRARGFKFVGPTIVYAYMQAAGLVNDHLVDCFRYEEIRRLTPR